MIRRAGACLRSRGVRCLPLQESNKHPRQEHHRVRGPALAWILFVICWSSGGVCLMNLTEPITWRADWAWGLPLILLTVATHVYGLGLVNQAVVRILNASAERRRFGTWLAAVMGAV